MDDYALSQAEFRSEPGLWGKCVRVLRHWRSRQSFRDLRHASNYQLRDIGLTRDDVERLGKLPLSVDAAWEAEAIRFRRSHGNESA